MTALSEQHRERLRALVGDQASFQVTDFIWVFADVEFHAVPSLGDAPLTAQRRDLMACTHRDDTSIEFRVVAVQRGNTRDFDLVCEYQPAMMFTLERVAIENAADISRPLLEWLAIAATQLKRPVTVTRQIDQLVAGFADKLTDMPEPYSEQHRTELATKLKQVAAMAFVLREGAPERLITSINDAHKDAKQLAETLAEVPRGRAMRWIAGIVARLDLAWQRSAKTDEAHATLSELWRLARISTVLGDDYRTRARLAIPASLQNDEEE